MLRFGRLRCCTFEINQQGKPKRLKDDRIAKKCLLDTVDVVYLDFSLLCDKTELLFIALKNCGSNM